MTQPKQPPPGVETQPQGHVVWLQDAAERLNKDPRTIIRAITAGTIRGGAVPRQQRLRWYVYADELAPAAPPTATAPQSDVLVEDLRAQLVSQREANRLLLASQQLLLDAGRATNEAGEKYRAVAQNYLDALGQFMTPGHLGDLADL